MITLNCNLGIQPFISCIFLCFYYYIISVSEMVIFVGKLIKIICPQESQYACQAFVRSMRLIKESCHLSAHLIWTQLGILKMTVVTQVTLTAVPQVIILAHKQVMFL